MAYPNQLEPRVTTTTATSSNGSRQLPGDTSLRQENTIDGRKNRQGGGTGVVGSTEQHDKFGAPLRGTYHEVSTVAASAAKEAAKEDGSLSSSSFAQPARGGVLHQTHLEPAHEDGAISSSNGVTRSINSIPSSPRASGSHQDSPALPAASAADAGAGGSGDGGGSGSGDGGAHGEAGDSSPMTGTPKGRYDVDDTTNCDGPKGIMVSRSELHVVTRGGGEGGKVDGSGGAGSERGAFSGRRSRPRSPAADNFGSTNRTHYNNRSVASPVAGSSPFSDSVGSRKRPKKGAAGGDLATAERGGVMDLGRAYSPSSLSNATSRQRNQFAVERNRPDSVRIAHFCEHLQIVVLSSTFLGSWFSLVHTATDVFRYRLCRYRTTTRPFSTRSSSQANDTYDFGSKMLTRTRTFAREHLDSQTRYSLVVSKRVG